MSREEPTTQSQSQSTQSDTLQRKKSKKRPRDETVKSTPVKKHKSSKESRTSDAVTDNSTPGRKTKSSSKDKKTKSSSVHTTTTSQPDNNRQSPFCKERISLYLTLSPIAYGSPLEGAIAEHISPLLLTYFAPLDGIVLSFDNARLSTHPESNSTQSDGRLLGQSLDEYGVTYVWLTADFMVFRPREGTVVEGVVNLQNQSTLGLLCYNYFNASIPRTQLPSEWNWVEAGKDEDNTEESHFVDDNGKKVEGLLSIRVKSFDTSNNDGVGTINIHGTLIEDGTGGGTSSDR